MTDQRDDRPGTLLEILVEAVRHKAQYNRNAAKKPRVILWTDKERQWESLMPQLSEAMPELWFATAPGDAVPEGCRGGSASYLRYQLEHAAARGVPVLYLPGIERANFRSPETFAKAYRHLYPYCHLGEFFCTANYHDWTVVHFLTSKDIPLGLEVPGDNKTKNTLLANLADFMSRNLADLRGKAINSHFLITLLAPDPIKSLLEWLGRGTAIAKQWGEARWALFQTVALSEFKINPALDGPLSAAQKLVAGGGVWDKVWERFCESPETFQAIVPVLGQVTPPNLFDAVSLRLPEQNALREKETAAALESLVGKPMHQARADLVALVKHESGRATSPWAKLGKAPLAKALVPLGSMVESMTGIIDTSAWAEAAQGYLEHGWKVDRAAREAFAEATDTQSQKAVTQALQAVYKPWLAELAHRVGVLHKGHPYPMQKASMAIDLPATPGTLVLFVDGLRADVALELAQRLQSRHQVTTTTTSWAPLPTVTATAKPAFQPLAEELGGGVSEAFEPTVLAKNKPCRTDEFRTLLKQYGYTVIGKGELGDINLAGWMETGSLDKTGHTQQGKLALHVEGELRELVLLVEQLLEYGWQSVRVVTDHGWLWMPGGLPHVEMPGHLTASKWSRCALAKPNSVHALPSVHWFWNNELAVVLPPEIGVFTKNTEYSHGGLSLQECLKVLVTIGTSGAKGGRVTITESRWKNLRLNVAVEGMRPGLSIDVRASAADAATSMLTEKAAVQPNTAGKASVYADDSYQDQDGVLVVLENNQVIAQKDITIGVN